MTDNLEIWDKFADIDPKFTKPITGKPYKGTSPNPQYIIKCLTEMFGPVGKGFGWTILKEEFTPLGDTVLHWCRIAFWWKEFEGVTQQFEEYGQTKAAYKTSAGSYMVDEDAPKKSLTDAIIKAASHLGVASNIFLGRWDDQKYVAEVNKDFREAEKSGPTEDKLPQKPISSAEQKRQLLEIDKDLLDAHSEADVKRLYSIWASIAERDGWSKDYWEEAKKRFKDKRDDIKARDDEGFPGDTDIRDQSGRRMNALGSG